MLAVCPELSPHNRGAMSETFAWAVRIKLARARIPIRFEANTALRLSEDELGSSPANPTVHLLTLIAPTTADELHAWAAREWAGLEPAPWSEAVTEADIAASLSLCVGRVFVLR